MNLIDEAFAKAQDVLRLCVSDRGFTACSMQHDEDEASNYHSVWARDSALTLMWALPLGDPELTQCARRSLETIFDAQTKHGHLPNYVEVRSGKPVYGGTGNIAGLDGPMWLVMAAWNYVQVTGDTEFLHKYYSRIHRTIKWLQAHDSNNCGLIEVPEASDWMDIFPRSYNVLYDEILWYRANVDFVKMQKVSAVEAAEYAEQAQHIRTLINQQFWPTPETIRENVESFAQTQYNLGRSRYLLAQITPFGFSWRCDVLANILAYLYGVIDEDRAMRVWRFLRQVGVDRPYPVRVLYPAVRPGAPDWRDYFLVNLQNLPHHYHNGGIWPFVGGLWVRFLKRLGQNADAERALRRLARLCRDGVTHPWEFTEWAHGETGMPMGKAFQAWSAASYVAAYVSFQGDDRIEVTETPREELTQPPIVGPASEDE